MQDDALQPNRRKLLSFLASSALITLIGCDSEPKPASTATLLNNDNVHKAVFSTDEALSDLETNVGNFDSENWREVVPEVKQATEELRDALDRLKQALGYTH